MLPDSAPQGAVVARRVRIKPGEATLPWVGPAGQRIFAGRTGTAEPAETGWIVTLDNISGQVYWYATVELEFLDGPTGQPAAAEDREPQTGSGETGRA